MEQAEDRTLEFKNKVEKSGHSEKDKDKLIRKHKWYFQDVSDTMERPNLRTVAMEEFNLKCIFSKVIAEIIILKSRDTDTNLDTGGIWDQSRLENNLSTL